MKFELNDKEEELYHEFYKKHKSCRDKLCEDDGLNFCPPGTISITFTPTGIASAIKVKCARCGSEENITDYDSW